MVKTQDKQVRKQQHVPSMLKIGTDPSTRGINSTETNPNGKNRIGRVREDLKSPSLGPRSRSLNDLYFIICFVVVVFYTTE